MAIIFLDKIKSGIPTTIIEGKDVDSVILVNPPEDLPSIFLKNKLVLNSISKQITSYDGGGLPTGDSYSIDATAVEQLVKLVETKADDAHNLAQSAHNLAVAAETEAVANTATIAGLSVTVALHGDKIAIHRGEITVLQGEMVDVKHSARAANLTADSALQMSERQDAEIKSLDTAVTVNANDITILGTALENNQNNTVILAEGLDALSTTSAEHTEAIATLETNDVGFISDIERIDAEIASIEAETVLRNGTDIHVKDISTSTGNFELNDPNRVIDKYDFKINDTSELTLTSDSVDLYTKPITNLGSGGDLDTNSANIGDVKRIALNTNPDLVEYVKKMSDAPLNSVEMEFGAIGSTADEGVIIEGDKVYAKSSSGQEHFFVENEKFDIKNKSIKNVTNGLDEKDAVNKGQLDLVKDKADSADSLSKSNQTDISTLGQTVGENFTQIGINTNEISTKASKESLGEVKAIANESSALSANNKTRIDTNETAISDIESEVINVTNRVSKNETDISSLGQTVGQHDSAISSLSIKVDNNSSEIDAVSDVANQADTLAKSNQSSITGLNSAVDNNTSKINTNETNIANVKITADTADLLSKSNQTELGNKATKSELNDVKGVANAADSLSKFNEAKLVNKLDVNSNIEVNSITNVTGNYSSTDNFDLTVNGSNVLSATSSALYAKKNLVMQSKKITGLLDGVDLQDAVTLSQLEAVKSLIPTDSGELYDGNAIIYCGFDKVKADGVTLKESMLDENLATNTLLNRFRTCASVDGNITSKFIVFENFESGVPSGINRHLPDFAPQNEAHLITLHLTHTNDSFLEVKFMNVTYKVPLHFNIGSGASGKPETAWSRDYSNTSDLGIKVYNTDKINWDYSVDPRTNTMNLFAKMGANSMVIGRHIPSSSDKTYKVVNKGSTSSLETQEGIFTLYKGQNGYGYGMFNVVMDNGNNYVRVCNIKKGYWWALSPTNQRTVEPENDLGEYTEGEIFYTADGLKQVVYDDNLENPELVTIDGYESPKHAQDIEYLQEQNELGKSKKHYFINESNVVIPWNNPDSQPITEVYVLDPSEKIKGLNITVSDDLNGSYTGTYVAKGSYSMTADNKWTSYSYHNTFKNTISNKYIVFNLDRLRWELVTTDVLPSSLSESNSTDIVNLNVRGQIPSSFGDYVINTEIEDVNSLDFIQAIISPEVDTINKLIIYDFASAKPSGYILIK